MSPAGWPRAPTARELTSAFDSAVGFTVGIEDEVLLLDPEGHGLVPRGKEVLGRVGADRRFKLELPAAQLEIVTPPATTVGEAVELLWRGRSDLALAAAPLARLGSAGVHPFSQPIGELNSSSHYKQTITTYRTLTRLQLVAALQVHVAVPGAGRALAVYNAARCYLPLLAALAANAPFYAGQDTGLASVRPKLCQLLPRQGIPPRLDSWQEYSASLRWGESAQAFHPGAWWWELRPHHRYGTVEFRVPDGQTTVRSAAGLAAVIQALVVHLAERHDAGETLPDAPAWKLAECRWLANRDGVQGHMPDLVSGRPARTRDVLHELLDRLEPTAARLCSARELRLARELVERNGAIEQREAASELGVRALADWLAERFLEPLPG